MLQNGLGYDAFMTRLENAAPSKSRVVVTMADVLGIHGNDANPHLWYDVPKLDRIATAIAARLLARRIRADAAAYRRGVARFERSLEPLRQRGRGDPCPLPRRAGRLHRAGAGLPRLGGRASGTSRPTRSRGRSRTEREPSASAVAAMNELIAQHRIRVLLYNSQAVSPITAQLRAMPRAKRGSPSCR